MPQSRSKPKRTSDIPFVEFNGVKYATPFVDLLRKHTAEELAEVRNAGKRNDGWISPVLTYDSPTYGPALIDGHTRLRLSAETGLPVHHMHLGPMSDEAAEVMAMDLNVARRHLSGPEQAKARKERIKRVAKLRKAGKSLRAIAAAEEVSEKQIRKDLKEAGADQSAPEKVEGRDGKTYPVQEMLRDLRKTIHPNPAARTHVPTPADDEPPAVFPRTHPHADLAARLDGLLRVVSDTPGLDGVVLHLRRARQVLFSAGAA